MPKNIFFNIKNKNIYPIVVATKDNSDMELLTYTFAKIAFAHLSPSIAAETIPPAYPAPSPQG